MDKDRLPEIKIVGLEGKEWDHLVDIVKLGIVCSLMEIGVTIWRAAFPPEEIALPYRVVSDVCGERNLLDCLAGVNEYLTTLIGKK